MKKIYLTSLLVLATGLAFSQLDSTSRRAYHYLGFQANQLARQLLNTSGANVDNPYLLVYSVNSPLHGHGLNIGLGLTYTQNQDGDTFTTRETTVHSIFFRAGYERKSMLSKKWMVSWGFDLVIDSQDNSTVSTVDFGQGSSTTETETKSNASGIGPRFSLSYKITDRIIIGTEATYYLKTGKNTRSVTQFGDTTENTDEFTKAQFAVPAVLLLIVRL